MTETIQEYGPIEDWDVSNVRNFASCFNKGRNPQAEFFQADLGRWTMTNALYLHDMFLGAAAFDADLSGWTVESVITFNGLFNGAKNFSGRGLDSWDVSSGQLFMVMFADTHNLDVDVRSWNVASARSFWPTNA